MLRRHAEAFRSDLRYGLRPMVRTPGCAQARREARKVIAESATSAGTSTAA